MEDKIRKDVAALFGEGYISLDILDMLLKSEENIVNLSILNMPAVKKEKCPYLSPLINCNVGGFAHVGCMDESFHTHCKFKLLHEKRAKSR